MGHVRGKQRIPRVIVGSSVVDGELRFERGGLFVPAPGRKSGQTTAQPYSDKLPPRRSK
jgi:hypothetical protein